MLPPDAFVPPLKQSIDLKGIRGFNASPSWYSPSPQNACHIHHDLALTDYVLSNKLVDRLDKLFLSP